MKMYVADFGWAGQIVVVANNEAEARLLMERCENYDKTCEVEEIEIKTGVVVYNMGDM